MEIWKDINGFEGLYQVSNYGNVRSMYQSVQRILKLEKMRKGYLRTSLHHGEKRARILVHRLVAQTFIPNPQNLPCINHKDENKANNRVDNLEWCTNEYNCNYGTRNLRTGLSRRKPIIVIEKETEDVFMEHNSLVDAAFYWGVSVDQIIYYCRTKRKPRNNILKRFKFTFKNEKDIESRIKNTRR